MACDCRQRDARSCDAVSPPKRWAGEVAQRRGLRRANVALARKLATVVHRIWVDSETFRWSREAAMEA